MGLKGKGRKSLFLRKSLPVLILTICLLAVGVSAVRRSVYVPNVSAVTTPSSLGVYWDKACTKPISTISWGNISVGSEKDVIVFIKNLGSNSVALSMNMSALTPSSAYLKIYLCWDYSGQLVGPGSTTEVTLRLFVTQSISGVSSFSFNINIEPGLGLNKSPNISGDGVVSATDMATFAKAWMTKAGEPGYDYRCDFNNEGIVDLTDFHILAAAWGH